MNNLKLKKLDEAIRSDIQNSGLSIGSVYYILKSIQHDVEFSFMSSLNSELLQQENDNTAEATKNKSE
ncbi:MAG: hypothetical protein HDT40_08305 [Lachnospiraceae bacterium]|nr:hypothetical protein [Lachnospiraceae bacterium]